MNKDIIDRIVWWIPIKKLRNDIRELLNFIVNKISLTEDRVSELHDNILPNEKLLYIYSEFYKGEHFRNAQYKIKEIIKYGYEYDCKICVETGTFMGDTTDICKDYFDKVYTIELSKDLFNKATQRFKDNKNVICLEGDSGIVLKELIKEINERTIFWLDGHYSGGITAKGDKETPILKELDIILSHHIKDHILLIDDARCFGTGDYPSIIEIERYIKKYRPECEFKLKNDIIRVIL